VQRGVLLGVVRGGCAARFSFFISILFFSLALSLFQAGSTVAFSASFILIYRFVCLSVCGVPSLSLFSIFLSQLILHLPSVRLVIHFCLYISLRGVCGCAMFGCGVFGFVVFGCAVCVRFVAARAVLGALCCCA
jgi:hypothetical protein